VSWQSIPVFDSPRQEAVIDKQDIQALEKVQRKGARFVTGKYS
jgi:hypothetical protein